ncbi:MAG: lipid-A-disaccharide synthase [Cellvibrionaceae bacterium]|jgi:lipid-A-disaccharide synthase
MKTVMISAGEASGDAHAANLVRALRELNPDIRVKGMGSKKLLAAGCDILVNCDDIGVVGIWEVIKKYRAIKRALNRMQAELVQSPPDLLILVDYQEFNFRLAAKAKALGVKVLFYISPQVWAWRPGRVHSMGEKIDHMAVLFPFEEKFYRDADVPCTFVGHPLVDEVKPNKSRAQCFNDFGLNANGAVVGIFPGSRKNEIKKNLPVQLKAASILKTQRPEIQFILPIASTIDESDLQPFLATSKHLSVLTVRDRPYNVIQCCDAIVTASGTATLEIALMGVPNTIVYRVAPLSYWIIKRLMTINDIGLVNIILGKNVVKEFLQGEANPAAIAKEIKRLLEDEDYRRQMITSLNQVRNELGKAGGSRHVAELASSMMS